MPKFIVQGFYRLKSDPKGDPYCANYTVEVETEALAYPEAEKRFWAEHSVSVIMEYGLFNACTREMKGHT